MSLNLVVHEWNSNSGMWSLFKEWFATHFLSDSPSFDFDNLAHMWLMPINTTARGQTPGDKGPLFLTTGKRKNAASLKLILPIRPVKHAYPKKNTTSIFQHPMGSATALIVLLKVCHIFLIIFTRIHVRGCSRGYGNANLCRGNMSDAFSWGKPRLALTNLSN